MPGPPRDTARHPGEQGLGVVVPWVLSRQRMPKGIAPAVVGWKFSFPACYALSELADTPRAGCPCGAPRRHTCTLIDFCRTSIPLK